MDLGRALHGLKRFDDAVVAFDKAIALGESSAYEWSCKALSLAEAGFRRDALMTYDQALSIDPHSDSTWCRKAHVLNELGETQGALDALREARTLDPACREAWQDAIALLERLGRVSEAEILRIESAEQQDVGNSRQDQ